MVHYPPDIFFIAENRRGRPCLQREKERDKACTGAGCPGKPKANPKSFERQGTRQMPTRQGGTLGQRASKLMGKFLKRIGWKILQPILEEIWHTDRSKFVLDGKEDYVVVSFNFEDCRGLLQMPSGWDSGGTLPL